MQSARHALKMCHKYLSAQTGLLQQQDLLKSAESGRRKHGLKASVSAQFFSGSIFAAYNICMHVHMILQFLQTCRAEEACRGRVAPKSWCTDYSYCKV